MENINNMMVTYIITNFLNKFEDATTKDEIYFFALSTMSSLMFLKQTKDINEETILSLIDKLETVYYDSCKRIDSENKELFNVKCTKSI